MKKLIVCVIIIIVSISCYAKSKHKDKLKYLKPRCLMGYLYYDWVGRVKYDAIPMLDKKGRMIPCKDECEE